MILKCFGKGGIMKQICVGNMNRFVKVTRKCAKDECCRYKYLFDVLTGLVIESENIIWTSDNDFYCLTPNHYPVFKDNNYVGCVWDGVFLTPEGFYAI